MSRAPVAHRPRYGEPPVQVDDSATFTAPFSGELPFTKIDEMIDEFGCCEGNYAMQNLLTGERAGERVRIRPSYAVKPIL